MPKAVAALFLLVVAWAGAAVAQDTDTELPIARDFTLEDRSAAAGRMLENAKRLEAELAAMKDMLGADTGTKDILKERPSLESIRNFRERYATELRLARTGDTPEGWHAAAQDFRNLNRFDDALTAGWKTHEMSDKASVKTDALSIMSAAALAGGDLEQAYGLLQLAIKQDPNNRKDLRTRSAQVRDRLVLRVIGTQADTEAALPGACLEFSEALKQKMPLELGDYIRIEGASDYTVRAEGTRLCVSGLKYGTSYEVTVLAGLPGELGGKLYTDTRRTVTIPDRTPRITLGNGTYVLPRVGDDVVPLTTVNMDDVMLALYRVPDRGLVPFLSTGSMGENLNRYRQNELQNDIGTLEWQGAVTVNNRRNEEVVTLLPLKDMVKSRAPGLYALVAEPPRKDDEERGREYWRAQQTQWLVVSDLGLMSMKAGDGLHVFVHSLETTKAVRKVKLKLVARNNEILGEVETGRDGRGDFAAALLKGDGGNRPVALTAETEDGDYAFLRLDGPALDLSDRGTGGRQAAGDLDAFVYTERGIYRPGETVHIATLLRNTNAMAAPDLPLTFVVRRPDGVENLKSTIKGDALGGYGLDLPLSVAARTGMWNIQVFAAEENRFVGSAQFQVEDFVPERVAASLKVEGDTLREGQTADAQIGADFLYGAPGAGLEGDISVTLAVDPSPFKDFADYSFGLVQEDFQATHLNTESFTTDAGGKARVGLLIEKLPETTKRLRALLQAEVRDISGRPVTVALAKPIVNHALELGIKAGDDGHFDDGEAASLDIVSLTPEGAPLPNQPVTVTLVKEHYSHYWFLRGDTWQYRDTSFDETVASEDLMTDATGHLGFSRKLDWGRYRLEVTDKDGATASSRRFYVGWWSTGSSPDLPDALEMTVEQTALKAGDTVRGFVKAPFAGKLMLAVVNNNSLVDTKTVDLAKDGSRFEMKVGKNWGPGGYILATALRPDAGAVSRLPVRATGLTWYSVDRAAHDRTLLMAVPDVARPLTSITVPVTVKDGKAGEAMKLMIAAVDEGVLRITRYQSPNPGEHYFGQRAFAADLYDIYGRLIRSQEGERGTIRTGGDARLAMEEMMVSGMRKAGDNAVSPVLKTVRTVALFERDVTLSADGTASVTLDLPDFAGSLRLMAVAYGKETVAQGNTNLIVRNPVVTELLLPRFLAPGDKAKALLSVQNLSGAATKVAIGLKTRSGHVGLDTTSFDLDLKDGERRDLPVMLSADAVGDDGFDLSVQYGDEAPLTRGWDISVRAAWPYDTDRNVMALGVGESFTVKPNNTAYIPGTVSRHLMVTTRPELDAARLMSDLYAYGYWCSEQTVSRVFPALFYKGLSQYYDLPKTADDAQNLIERSLVILTDRQRADGGFGIWNSYGSQSNWLNAYVTDFLLRAREAGHYVSDNMIELAVGRLKQQVTRRSQGMEDRPGTAYSLYVLARIGEVSASEVRYFAERTGRHIPSALARGQVAAALMLVGEKDMGEKMFRDALNTSRGKYADLYDYGSVLRDRAALARLMNEVAPDSAAMADIAESVEKELGESRYLSTQEMSWIAQLAASYAPEGTGGVGLLVNGEETGLKRGTWSIFDETGTRLGATRLTNSGSVPARVIEAVRGVKATPPEASSNGISIERQYFTLDGTPVDPKTVKRNTRLAVVLTGTVSAGGARNLLVVDLLPAGFEIETTDTVRLPFVNYRAYADYTDARDDRFVAAVDVGGQWFQNQERKFTVSYIVRAVTVGSYVLPGPFAEEMYQPAIRAQGETGTMTVEP
ncbi:MAG: alpha-2-macroglobulin family protein [Alphaproteobacteria bacterium]|nr:MAG: alpha-2-macroglobulin family protein [Alphaproteobacteria bacterium]